MNYTQCLNLKQPESNEIYDVEQFNENALILDNALFRSVTAGVSSALTVDRLPIDDQQRVLLKLHVNIDDGATLNGKPILTSEGESISSGAVAGSFLLLAYNANKDSWYQIGGSGGGFFIKIAGSDKKAYFEFNPEDEIVYVKEA